LLIEQPLLEHDLQGTAKLRRMIDIPIMLDESIRSIYDVLTAVKFEACDMVSVKTMKAGGLLKIKEITKMCAKFSEHRAIWGPHGKVKLDGQQIST